MLAHVAMEVPLSKAHSPSGTGQVDKMFPENCERDFSIEGKGDNTSRSSNSWFEEEVVSGPEYKSVAVSSRAPVETLTHNW